jgi:hypothetical protein
MMPNPSFERTSRRAARRGSTHSLNGPERLLFNCPTGGFGSEADLRFPT